MRSDGIQTLISGSAFRDVHAERISQDHKWGRQDRLPSVWLAILTEEVGEVARHIIDSINYKTPVERHLYRQELVQVAAVAIAAVESLDRNHAEGEKRTHGQPDYNHNEVTETDDEFLEPVKDDWPDNSHPMETGPARDLTA